MSHRRPSGTYWRSIPRYMAQRPPLDIRPRDHRHGVGQNVELGGEDAVHLSKTGCKDQVRQTMDMMQHPIIHSLPPIGARPILAIAGSASR
jgi:hypothetical protein